MNQYRITLVSFLAYFIMSGMLSPIGILTGPMAEYFDLPITEVTQKFSWLTMGILGGAGLALFVFDWLKIKTLMLVVYTALGLSLASMFLTEGLDLVGYALGLVGVACGIGLAGAASTISGAYADDSRASMLVITDGCFSVAGIVCSYLAVHFIAEQFHWAGVYGFVGLITVLLLVLTSISDFPEHIEESEVSAAENELWPVSIWLCIGALFLYTLGQYSMLWWLPNYATTALGVETGQAGELVGRFWTGMFAAQIFVAWWVLKIGVDRLLMIGAFTTVLGSIPLWLVTDVEYLVVLALVWGFGNLGLLKIMISFGTLMVEKPSPRLISALLFGATTGTAVSPYITSQIVEMTSNYVVLQFSSACYAALAILLLLAGRFRPTSQP
jgi:TsgA-like MFS transporter